MSRIVDPNKACLRVENWPAEDQVLWNRMIVHRDLEDEDMIGVRTWRPTTVQTYREGYGRWMTFVVQTGADLKTLPPDRVTSERVRNYIAELKSQGMSPQSLCNRVSQLFCVIVAFDPAGDWAWLKKHANRLAAIAKDARQRPVPRLLSGDVLGVALKALDEIERRGLIAGAASAVECRNWLMVASLGLMPLRRHNFARLSVRDLRKNDDGWTIEIGSREAKSGKEITMPVPSALHRHFDFYLERARPRLLREHVSDALWISAQQTPMVDHSLYIAITNFTREKFGVAVNPHHFRHIAATSIVMAAPERLEAARALLSHADNQTTEEHYILGRSLNVSRQHAKSIAALRQKLSGKNVGA